MSTFCQECQLKLYIKHDNFLGNKNCQKILNTDTSKAAQKTKHFYLHKQHLNVVIFGSFFYLKKKKLKKPKCRFKKIPQL